jgi:hypothetical protein
MCLLALAWHRNGLLEIDGGQRRIGEELWKPR